MPSDDPTYRPDDELLSAYLDGELTDGERADIEARLADDPVAQQTLDDLRSVSRAVRDLPHDSRADGDMRDEVLARVADAQRKKFAPVVETSASSSDLNHPITFGRSRRGWVWAALAVAAAVAIMVTQDLSQPAGDNRELARGPVDQPAVAPPTVDFTTGDEFDRFGGGRGGDGVVVVDGTVVDDTVVDDTVTTFGIEELESLSMSAESDPAPLAQPARPTSGLVTPDADASGAVPFDAEAGLRPALEPAAELPAGRSLGELEDILAANNTLLVRVSMPAEARRNQVFENKLRGCSIILDESATEEPERRLNLGRQSITYGAAPATTRATATIDAPTDESLVEAAAPNQVAAPVESQLGALQSAPDNANVQQYWARRMGEQRSQDGTPVEIIACEAPQTNVYQCLSEMENDPVNFSAIEVEETDGPIQNYLEQSQLAQQTQDYAYKAINQSRTLERFNRGQIPREQRVLDARSVDSLQRALPAGQLPRMSAQAREGSAQTAVAEPIVNVLFFVCPERTETPLPAEEPDPE
jgi:hypothetical protein